MTLAIGASPVRWTARAARCEAAVWPGGRLSRRPIRRTRSSGEVRGPRRVRAPQYPLPPRAGNTGSRAASYRRAGSRAGSRGPSPALPAATCIVHPSEETSVDFCLHCGFRLDGLTAGVSQNLLEQASVRALRAMRISSEEEERTRDGYDLSTHFRSAGGGAPRVVARRCRSSRPTAWACS